MSEALHPAKFSDAVLAVMAGYLHAGQRVLDPFAGTGRIHRLRALAGVDTVGIEIEPEWAALHPDTICGDCLELPIPAFDVLATSPCYGNRYADHHEARDGSRRRSYTHDLGRSLHPNNAGRLQWGPEYRRFHERVWARYVPAIPAGGLFVLNIKDHQRRRDRARVADWHSGIIVDLGLEALDAREVDTGGMRFGANRERYPEEIRVFGRPS